MILLALVLMTTVQETPGDKAVRRYLADKAADLEKDLFPALKTAADFDKARPALREAYLDMLGLRPLPPRTPLQAKITNRAEHETFIVENLHYQSRPGLYVTANLYLPKTPGKYPAIFYSCGHAGMKRDGNKTAYQDHGIWFASHGYVCLVVDTLQLGEIAAIHHGTYREQRWWWHSAGYTPAGVECWNAIRGLDYLQSRPEVDPDRIGATGISGGGAATFWIAAADERVKVSVPVSGMADLGFYVAQDGVNGHCDCMFLYNSARWNWTAIAALVCPRPMLFANSDKDGIFPMSANNRVIARLEGMYAMFGASDHVDAMVSVGGHAYREDLRRAIFEFFNRHLKGDSRRVDDAQSGLAPDGKRRLEPSTLRAFPRDEDIPADPLNTKIDETFVPVAKVTLPEPEHFNVWRMALLDDLKKTSFGAWTDESIKGGSEDGQPLKFADLGGGLEIAWRRLRGADTSATRWLIVLSPDENIDALPGWARGLVETADSVLVRTRGIGPGSWTRKNPPNTIERSLALVGATVDSGRVWDVMTVARGNRWRAAGRGPAGVIAAYAALYEPGIESVVLVDPPASHRAGPHFLGVLRVLDIPDALGCLAPRPLTLIGAKDPAFDRTMELYRIAGAQEKLERK